MLSQENRWPWGAFRVLFDVGGLHTTGPVVGRLPLVDPAMPSVIASKCITGSGWAGLSWTRPVAFLPGVCGLEDGDLDIVVGATCSAHAPGTTARFGLGRPPPVGASCLGLLPLVDIVNTLATRLEVGGSGGGTRIVGDVHVV